MIVQYTNEGHRFGSRKWKFHFSVTVRNFTDRIKHGMYDKSGRMKVNGITDPKRKIRGSLKLPREGIKEINHKRSAYDNSFPNNKYVKNVVAVARVRSWIQLLYQNARFVL